MRRSRAFSYLHLPSWFLYVLVDFYRPRNMQMFHFIVSPSKFRVTFIRSHLKNTFKNYLDVSVNICKNVVYARRVRYLLKQKFFVKYTFKKMHNTEIFIHVLRMWWIHLSSYDGTCRIRLLLYETKFQNGMKTIR